MAMRQQKRPSLGGKAAEEAKQARKAAKVLEKAEVAIQGDAADLDTVLVARENSYIKDQLDAKPALRTRLCSLLQHGLLEQVLNRGENKGTSAEQVGHGHRCFPAADAKWRQLNARNAQEMLKWMEPKTEEWFLDKDFAKAVNATSTVHFALAVTGKSAIPQGPENPHYASSLQPVVVQRYKDCGERLNSTTKDDLVSICNYWELGVNSDKIVCLTAKGVALVQLPFKDDDTTLHLPGDYAKAYVANKTLGIDGMLVHTLYEAQHADKPVLHEGPFNYPGFEDGAARAAADPGAVARAAANSDAAAQAGVPASILSQMPPRQPIE